MYYTYTHIYMCVCVCTAVSYEIHVEKVFNPDISYISGLSWGPNGCFEFLPSCQWEIEREACYHFTCCEAKK